MFIKGIPDKHIVHEAARLNKDYEIEFVNSNKNSDIYTLQAFLRRSDLDNDYKIRVLVTSNTLAYPAFEMTWSFADNEYDLASRVYHRVCNEVDDIKTGYDRSMAPITVVVPHIREAVKPISTSHIVKAHMVPIDESQRLAGEADPRFTLYRGQYPQMSKEEKHAHHKFKGNQEDPVPNRKSYPSRSRSRSRK